MNKFKSVIAGINAWFHILLFPLFISFIISFIIYLIMPDALGMLLILIIVGCGLLTGLIYASLVWKKRGLSGFAVKEEPLPQESEQPDSED